MAYRKKGDAEKFLADLGHRIDELIEKAKNSEGKVKGKFEQGVEELKKTRDLAENELEKLKKHSENEEFETKFGQSLNDLKHAFEQIKDRHFPSKKD
ncbi:MAG: hypothetical protein MI784_09950 [Cytophagales bacterium]|nr:hypothetical protein [Cytophagales bacterium]